MHCNWGCAFALNSRCCIVKNSTSVKYRVSEQFFFLFHCLLDSLSLCVSVYVCYVVLVSPSKKKSDGFSLCVCVLEIFTRKPEGVAYDRKLLNPAIYSSVQCVCGCRHPFQMLVQYAPDSAVHRFFKILFHLFINFFFFCPHLHVTTQKKKKHTQTSGQSPPVIPQEYNNNQ